MDSPGLAQPGLRTRRRLAADGSLPAATAEHSFFVLGSWRPTQLVHRGQRLVLYRAKPAAEDLGPGCYVIKTLLSDHQPDELARALLMREALVATQVQHANLATTLAACLGSDQRHLVLPYLDGITLRRLIEATPVARVAPRLALWIARQLAGALAALHAAGWLHGQLRPEHVIISPQGHATLIDLSQTRRLA